MPSDLLTADPFPARRTMAVGGALRLRCPRCAVDIAGTICHCCTFRLEKSDDIVHALPPERLAHYARFIADYEWIRAAEGRGSESEQFYCELPYKDVTGRNSAQWRIRSLSYRYLVRHLLQANLPLGARIADLGAGNCWMSFRLALAGYLPVAVDLLTNRHDGLGASMHYCHHVSQLFPLFQAELMRLPFQAEQFDAMIFNASFHYAENAEAALHEAVRCTRPGGLVIISDTPWYSKEESGRQMVAERHATFLRRYGIASDSIRSLDYLTDARLHFLSNRVSIAWAIHSPWYGIRWSLRPIIAKLRCRREPSRFQIYVAQKEQSAN